MVIEMLPELIAAIRAAAMANDNAPATTRPTPAAIDADTGSVGPPLVRGLRRRPGMTYARSGNVILPLQFAERMRGWHAPARFRPRNQG